MKTLREKRIEKATRFTKQIWKSVRIESAVKVYGLSAVKGALSKWLNYQRENQKLLRQKRELEKRLAEVNSKI